MPTIRSVYGHITWPMVALNITFLLSSVESATAGASTGTWKYYPHGVYSGYGYGRGYRRGYGRSPAYGYGVPSYGYGVPSYGYGDPGYGYEPYQQRYDPGAALAAGVIGLTAGAILSGALSQQRTRASCTQYRSYDPRTGTYIGRGGVRYRCR